jgi:undecaprenyl-diphosphatase
MSHNAGIRFQSFLSKITAGLANWVRWDYFYITLILALSLWQFVRITWNVVTRDEITQFDESMVVTVNALTSSAVTNLALVITSLGSEYVIPVLAVISVAGFVSYRQFPEAALVTTSTLGGLFYTLLFKEIFGRTRPIVETSITLEPGYSLPSGHATIGMCFYGAFIYLIFRRIRPSWGKHLSITGLMTLILLIGLSRVYLGVHYPSDVLAGWFLGFSWLCLTILIYRRFWETPARFDPNT